ncbi:cytochrome c3 family protein [Melioribacteraceae bacterium 4301-Me]|uniref:cytochrome c3 family protein n=1 Tax=Pyranulibacter aquaticus TaxID=3163344 RepID=UPI00359718E3
MKPKYFYIVVSVIIIGFLAIAASSTNSNVQEKSKTNKEIIKFSHKVHLDASVNCADCHTKVPESTSLSDKLLPDMETCGQCHDVQDEKNCNMCHYENVQEPLIQKTATVIFNHKFHIGELKVECTTCHKGLDKVNYAFESTETTPSMSTCYSCHNNTTVATNNCETCHTSTVNLIPQDHKEVSFLANHKFASNSPNAQCQMCHNNDFCESCHVSTNRITEKNAARDFYAPYSPHKYVDDSKQQQITQVHDLNYVYTHGIDFKGKSAECQTCHQIETFCAECHSSKGGDFALEGIVPTSHLLSNFVTIGVGSGGGQHAILAKQDIENCASCHDVEGADPTCIVCHTDSDGIKGTNPKTHPANFMKDNHGDWHSDSASLCFTCHTDANARPNGIKGVGFCGYCHK